MTDTATLATVNIFGVKVGDIFHTKLCKVKSGYRGSPMVVLCRDHSADLWDGRPKFDSGAWGR